MDIHKDEDFDNFRKHILPRNCHMGMFFCGSFYELPVEYAVLNLTDLDQMFFDRKLIAATNSTVISDYFHGEKLTIEIENCHLGFARLLRRCKEKTENFVWNSKFLHQPAITKGIMTSREVNIIRSVAVAFLPGLDDSKVLTVDTVCSVLCPHWPSEANEWRTRKRNFGWPTKYVIDKIVEGGCYLVPKSHENNQKNDTWRYSFSLAELILIDTWNEVQKYIYHILRILKADVIAKCDVEKKSFICTYYFKTLMLWFCEEKPSSFWSEDRIEAAVEELLLTMVEWLIEKHCPNYFVRENNMLDYLQSDFDVTNEAVLLLAARLDISTVVSIHPKVYCGKMLHVQVSHKVVLLLQLPLNRRMFFNVMNNTRERYVVKNLSSSALLRQEVEHLFRAVQLHRLLMIDMSSSEAEIDKKRKSYEIEALVYFQKSCEEKVKKNYTYVFISSLDSLSRTVNKLLKETPCEYSQCCRQTDKSNLTKAAMEALCQAVMSKIDKNHHDPSYFISAAYYANFYYTCLQGHREALEICDEALETFGALENDISLNTFEPFYSNEVLCVFINHRYVDIFDAGIQVVFGFLTLCMTTIKQNEFQASYQRVKVSDLYFQMCPVEFLEYIRILCKGDRAVDKKFFREVEDDSHTSLRKMSNAIFSAAISAHNKILS